MTSSVTVIAKATHTESSHSHLKTIVGSRLWLAALNQWYEAGSRPTNPTRAESDLDAQSWQELQFHLCGTGWFTTTRGVIEPTAQGQDLLTRVNELYRAVRRQDLEDQVVGSLLAAVPQGGAVDIGCGPGHSTLRLARLGFRPLFAYDLSPVAIALARALMENEGSTAQLYARSATYLTEIEDHSLALVFSRGALHYFKQIDLARTVKRTLRPGGYLIAEIVGLRYYLQRETSQTAAHHAMATACFLRSNHYAHYVL